VSAALVIAVALAAAAGSAALPRGGRTGALRPFVAVAGLLICAALAVEMDPLRPFTTSMGTLLLGTDGSLVVLAASVSLALLVGAGVAVGSPSDLPAALALALAALATALGVLNGSLIENLGASAPIGATGSPIVALSVAAAASMAVTPLVASGAAGRSLAEVVRTASRQVRSTAAASAIALAGMAWLLGTTGPILADPVGVAAALALVATGTVIFFGAVPAHPLAARATALGPALATAARAAWLPAVAGLAIVAWEQRVLDPSSVFLAGATGPTLVGSERALLSFLAFVTLVGGAIAAAWHDDLRHVVAYALVTDGAFALLALASGDPTGAAAAQDWLPLNALAKTALLAWSLGIGALDGTASIDDLRGWARRRPLLALGLVAIAMATFGLPGWGVWTLRLTLARAGAGPFGPLMVGAAWVGLLPYLRLAWAGLASPVTAGAEAATVEDGAAGPPTATQAAPSPGRFRGGPMRALRASREGRAGLPPDLAAAVTDPATIVALLALGVGVIAVLMSWAVGGSVIAID
jgi:hypothetical protein